MANKNSKKAVVVAVAPAINKTPKTVLDGGMTYALVSRVLNAMNADVRLLAEAGETTPLVDGRGVSHDVSVLAVALANSLGAKFLSSVKSAYLRPRMVVDWSAKTVTLDESLVKIPFIKKSTEEREKIAAE